MTGIEEELTARGLEMLGMCHGLSQRGEMLQHSPLLDNFTPDEAERLGAVMPHVRAKPGQVLIQEETIGNWMLLILSGTVDVTRRSGRGTPSRIAVIKSGASIGEMSMLDGAPRSATCAALEEVEAAVLTRTAIEQLIREHPAVGAKLMVKLTQLLAQRLRNTSYQLIRLRVGPAPDAPAAVKARLKRRATDW